MLLSQRGSLTRPLGKVLEVKKFEWTWDNEAVYPLKNYSKAKVDPHNAQPHNIHRVSEKLYALQEATVNVDVTYYVLHHELEVRCNAYAEQVTNWALSKPEFQVVMSAKRTPIPYNMTDYLVAHEYGHIMDYTISNQLGIECEEFRKIYARVRGADPSIKGWINTATEVIADDFRILCGQEQLEFWPHTDVEYPSSSGIYDWWEHIMFTPQEHWNIDELNKLAK